MSDQIPLEKYYLSLVEFLMLAKQHVFELGTEQGLSGMQVVTLLLIDSPRQMSSLKHIFNCDPSNVTGILDGLEQKQLVARYENANDRRTKMVKLLARGKRMRSTLLQKLIASNDFLLAKLSPAEMIAFITLVQKITQDSPR